MSTVQRVHYFIKLKMNVTIFFRKIKKNLQQEEMYSAVCQASSVPFL